MASNFHDSGAELAHGVHLMPFYVDHCGPHPALAANFQPQPSTNNTLTAAFRGRELEGNTLELPSVVHGRVLVPGPVRMPAAAATMSAAAGAAARRAALKRLKRKKDDWSDASSDEEVPESAACASVTSGSAVEAARPDSTWSTQHRFSKLNYWLHDERPSPNDQPQQCLQWMKDAAEIHRQLSQADIDAVCALLPKQG